MIENSLTFRINTGCYLKLLIPETIKLLGNTKRKVAKDENGKNVPHLKITEVVLVPCNIADNNYQQNLRVFYAFVPNKSLGPLLGISSKNLIFLKTFNSELY